MAPAAGGAVEPVPAAAALAANPDDEAVEEELVRTAKPTDAATGLSGLAA